MKSANDVRLIILTNGQDDVEDECEYKYNRNSCTGSNQFHFRNLDVSTVSFHQNYCKHNSIMIHDVGNRQ